MDGPLKGLIVSYLWFTNMSATGSSRFQLADLKKYMYSLLRPNVTTLEIICGMCFTKYLFVMKLFRQHPYKDFNFMLKEIETLSPKSCF